MCWGSLGAISFLHNLPSPTNSIAQVSSGKEEIKDSKKPPEIRMSAHVLFTAEENKILIEKNWHSDLGESQVWQGIAGNMHKIVGFITDHLIIHWKEIYLYGTHGQERKWFMINKRFLFLISCYLIENILFRLFVIETGYWPINSRRMI